MSNAPRFDEFIIADMFTLIDYRVHMGMINRTTCDQIDLIKQAEDTINEYYTEEMYDDVDNVFDFLDKYKPLYIKPGSNE